MMPAVDYGNYMNLKSLLAGIDLQPSVPDIPVAGLKLDSREIESGDAFIALSGTRYHGMSFGEIALKQGAAAVLYDPKDGGQELADRIKYRGSNILLAIDQLDQQLGLIADRFFQMPSADMTIIGVTGTDGKTSCSHFISQSLNHDRPSAVIGTLGWGFPGQLQATQHTTPHAIELQGNLAALVQQGVKAVAMEVSSHAQVQGRVNGVRFKGVLFTNIGRDHLDYHGTVQAYLEAKLRILSTPGLEFIVVNLDDPSTETIIEAVPQAVYLFGFSRNPGSARLNRRVINPVHAFGVIHRETGIHFQVEYGESKMDLDVPIFGDFNVDNLLATITCLIAMGYSLEQTVDLLAQVGAVPGRLERFSSNIEAPSAVVDYAHTPQALEKALESVRQHCKGQLWLVFGCGGDRDRGKRPQMGRIAERLADRVVVTDDNPRYEDAQIIVQDILEGCQGQKIRVIRDRKTAIYSAIEQAQGKDLVLVAGKGHETTQEISGIKYPFSDRKIVREALLQRPGGELAK